MRLSKIFETLETLPWALSVLIVVAAFVAFAIVGIFFVRKTANLKNLKAHNDVGGIVFTSLGMLYAVLLGFIAVDVQQRFDKIKKNSQIEASILSQLYRDAEIFPEKNREDIREALKNYGESVVHREWALMAEGKESLETIKALRVVWQSYYHVNPTNSKEQAWYSESISKLNSLMQERLLRLMGSREFLGSEMWSFLLIGGIVMVVFICLLGFENLTLHILMASVFAASVAFLLYMIYSLDTAFSGQVSVPPDALIRVLYSFKFNQSDLHH